MTLRTRREAMLLALCLFVAGPWARSTAGAANDAAASPPAVDPSTLASIVETAMKDDWAWRNLAVLTDTIGPRLSGSPQLTAAIARVSTVMSALGAHVTVQPVKVPHWVRGQEFAEIVEYPGRPAGLTQALHLTTLGGSSATPAKGLTARVVVLHDMDELKARAADIHGSIVLFDPVFDQRLADNGRSFDSYRQAGLYRFKGPAAAQAFGAAAVLVRSIGGADYRLPHTGLTRFEDGQPHVPAAALAAEDADLIARLATGGNVTLKLILTAQTLPDADSANVIADWPGREKAGDYVVVSGHLDSWDLATGATDDGVGVMAAAGVIEVLKRLDLHPRRTIRFVGWTNEENGSRGGAAYFKSVEATIASQVAAIESDDGAGRSLGIAAAVTKESLAQLGPVMRALGPIGATALASHDDELGSDIGPLQAAGVPGFAPLVDARHYFDYHHTAADTLDKVDPRSMASQVATMAVLAFYLADLPEPLPRFPVHGD